MSFASEAALSALLRYAPQKSALAELRQNAEDTYRQSVQAGRSSGVLGVQAVNRAIPEMRGVYNRAEQSANRAHELLAPTLNALGPKAQGYKTAAENERAYNTEAGARERAASLNQLQQEKVAAAEGPAFTARAAGQSLVNELAKILTREGSLSGQEGAYAAGELEKLQNAYNKEEAHRKLTERGQNITRADAEEAHHTSEHNSERAHPGGPNAVKPQSSAGMAKGAEAVQTMLARLNALPAKLQKSERNEGSRARLINYLSSEQPEESANESPTGQKTAKVPGFPVGPQMNAAIDQWIYGYINPTHGMHLREQGYDPKALGLTTEREYRSSHPKG